MLQDLESLVGASVVATDGEIGHISDFLFDDRSWDIRYLVVDVRSWLSRREVVIAISAIEPPDWDKKIFRVRMTKEEASQSPDVDIEQPVARQQEVAMERYFGRFSYWVSNQMVPSSALPSGTDYIAGGEEESHLRNTWHLAGYRVWATDDPMGRLHGFILCSSSWHISYLIVRAGDWLFSHTVLVPTRWVESISWAERRVNLSQTREGQ
jgi:hypothetical protein